MARRPGKPKLQNRVGTNGGFGLIRHNTIGGEIHKVPGAQAGTDRAGTHSWTGFDFQMGT
jgi:hypothetical protein